MVLVSMLGVTSWASQQCALWAIPGVVGGHPWFIATLFDTYWAFLTFYCWVVVRSSVSSESRNQPGGHHAPLPGSDEISRGSMH